jgi:hypothetical protein
MINDISWTALVIRPTRPGFWLVGAADAPQRDAIFTDKGTILICKDEDRPKGRGKGSGKAGLKGRPMMSQQQGWRPTSTTPGPDPPSGAGPVQSTITMMEDKIHDKLKEMQQEALTTHKLLKADLEQLRSTVEDRHQQQEQTNTRVQERFQTMESTFTSSLQSCVEVLQKSLQSQREDLKKDMQQSGEHLKAELTDEVRAKLSIARKRTPSPSSRMDEDKKQKS